MQNNWPSQGPSLSQISPMGSVKGPIEEIHNNHPSFILDISPQSIPNWAIKEFVAEILNNIYNNNLFWDCSLKLHLKHCKKNFG